MKKITLMLTLALSAMGMQAQNSYTFSAFTQPYTDLQTPTSINNGEVWDWDNFSEITMPFSFSIAGQQVNRFLFDDDYFAFITPNGSYEEEEGVYYLYSSTAYLQDRTYSTGTSTSPISYKVEGTAPNRILKLEVKNAGLENAVFADYEEDEFYLNVQIWLYEGTNTIEYRYGPNNVTDMTLVADGEEEGLLAAITDDYNAFVAYGNSVNPTYVEFTADTFPEEYITLDAWPANGTVYKFAADDIAGTPSFSAPVVSLYPNPASSVVNVSSNGFVSTQYTITNTMGAVISHGNLNSTDNAQVNIETLAGGMYFINVDGQHLKFIKR